jgi:hypothetical protein
MSPQDTAGRPGEDKPEGFSKYLKRMKTVLRSRPGSKRQSLVVDPEPATASTSTPAYAPTIPISHFLNTAKIYLGL